MASAESSPLVAALLGGKKSAAPRKAATKKAPAAQAPMAAPTEYKPPSMAERMKDRAKYAKLDATSDWVSGRISTAQHNKVHSRANHVIKNAHSMARGCK